MQLHRQQPPAPAAGSPAGRAAWTMIEMIGVLAIVSILALALVPLLIKQIDRLAYTTEQQELKKLSDGYQHLVTRLRQLPDAASFANLMATELGTSANLITTNGRGLRRAFVIDPRLRAGTTTNSVLPFIQSWQGSLAPVSPRLLFISSIAEPLPDWVTNGVATSANAFDAMWNATEGVVPSDWSWVGQGEHLLVQRLELGGEFLQVTLNNQSLSWGRWAVDSSATNSLSSAVWTTYYLRGSVLRLVGHDGVLQTSEVLQNPVSYVYENNTWRGKLFLGVGGRSLTGFDLQSAADLFISAPSNPNAKGGATTYSVLNAISNHMVAYMSWANAGFPYANNLIKPYTDSQVTVANESVNLLFKP